MPDICDHANDEIEFLNQIQLSRISSATHQPSATHCCDCRAPFLSLAARHYRASADVWIASPSWNISHHLHKEFKNAA